MAEQARNGRGAVSAGAVRAERGAAGRPALSQDDPPLRPLGDLLRLPRPLALQRLAFGLAGRAAAAQPLEWFAGATRTRGPRALVPDAWPGQAAIGQEIARNRFPLLGRTLPAPQPPFRPVGADQRWPAALNCSRNRRSAWLTAGWVNPIRSAARVACPSATSASKTTSRLRSMLAR